MFFILALRFGTIDFCLSFPLIILRLDFIPIRAEKITMMQIKDTIRYSRERRPLVVRGGRMQRLRRTLFN